MASREEGAPPELNDFQISSSWFPSTPAKPNSTTQNPICGNLQADDPCQPNWAEPGQFNPVPHPILCQLGQLPVEDYAGNSQCQAATACYIPADLVDVSRHPNNWQADNAPNSVYEESLSCFDTWQSSKRAESSARGDIFYTPDKYPTRDVDSLGNMSFQTLLAMADAGGSQVALNNVLTDGACVGTGSCCTDPRCNLPFETRQYAMNCGNSRLQGQVMRQATFGTELDMASVFTGVSSVPPRMPFDLNLLPRTMTTDAAFSKNHQFLFEPITPQKNNKGEYQQDPVTGKDAENNIISGDRVMEPLGNKEKLHQFIDQSSAATSAQLQENHKPDKGGTDEVDFTKTPQQKPRRKKHRPKVIIEGQKKSTPKSTAKTPSGVQETTRVKRKYVRRKGVGIPSVEEFNGIGVNHKEVSSTDAPTSGRKYTRRKVANKPGVDLDKETPKATDAVPPRHTRSSCKRTLNFIPDGQVGDESSSHSMNQLQEDNSSNMDPLKDNNMLGGDQTLQSRGKCQIVFSDVTHDKEANTVQVRMNPDSQMMPKSPGDSICSSACLTPERQVTGLKRQNMGTVAESEIYNSNEAGTVYNFMQGYTSIFSQNADKNNGSPGFHFPTIYKKKRTEKGHNMVASSSQQTRPTSENHVRLHIQSLRGSFTSQLASVTNQWSSSGQCQVTNLLSTNPGIDSTQNGRRSFGDLLALGPTESIRKRRSKGPTRQRNLASLLEICGQLPASTSGAATSRMRQHIAFEQEPPTCMEALVANTRLTMATKKRSKRSMLINPPVQNLYNHQKSDTTSMGPPLSLTWRYMSPVDSIVEQLSQLDLNSQSSQASVDKRNAFMAYHTNYLEQHAIVPYQRSGAVVPFGGSFDQVRRRRPRPKVDLDDETTRVWKLLLENINSEGIDGTDEEKTKWWEEERRVFNGRADSFIARMHLVQGDRRFSPWKGSVVDSVVGVFLTQNVSDHLSSSAFMSMAARFPLKSKTRSSDLHEEELGAEEACGLDPDATFDNINQSVCGDNTKMRQDFEVEGIREVNSINTSGNNTDGFILKDTLGCQSPNTSKNGGVMSHDPATDKSASLIEDGREAEDTFSSRTPEISSQNSSDSTIAQTTEKSDSCLPSTSEEPTAGADTNIFNNPTSFVKLLQMAGNVIHGDYEGRDKTNYGDNQKVQSERLTLDLQNEAHLNNPMFPAETIKPSSKSTMCDVPNSGSHRTVPGLSKQNSKFFNSSCGNELSSADISDLSSESASGTTFQKIADANFEVVPKSVSTHATSSNNVQGEINQRAQVPGQSLFQENQKMQEASESQIYPQNLMDITGSSNNMDNFKNPEHKEVNSSKTGPEKHRGKKVDGSKAKPGRPRKENEKRENQADWDQLRKDTLIGGTERAKTANTMDSVDWDAVRCADVNEIAQTIKERGMNNMLAERIKDFLNRIVRDHGSIDLEWLRDVPPDKAKEYLLSIWGLGLKSVECVRLLTLHHLAFPVDTNVGRIAVRLGWVPLQPLPESLQLHLLEMYPILESIQKYLWPRLCKLDQRTLYELHYQMITFGKVFCTKSKPNCNACPMRGECRHFASAFASARLALPAPEEKSIVKATENREAGQNPMRRINTLQLPSPEAKSEGSNSQPIIEEPPEAKSEGSNSQPIIEEPPEAKSEGSNSQPIIEEPPSPEPFTEVPATPEQVYAEGSQCDIENAFMEDPDEIPTIKLNMEEFTHNLQKIMQQNTELQEGDMSKALVALTSDAASIPVPKLKNMNRLRTEHQVYELPESHPLLEGMEKREPDDPSPYLLAIWTPGETADSTEPPERRCSSHEFEKLCTDEACLSCNSIRESNSQTVRGTILIPCRTAMRGSFPLNGTYFQVNEVFSDHESSVSPINVPRHWLWNLPRRTVYFGTSIPTIFKGLTTEGIQYCFWRGFVCVRGFDRKTRAPRPLLARFHFPASRMTKGKGKTDEN